jgi:alpha-tubulin suppressor-like RCC1 family protein
MPMPVALAGVTQLAGGGAHTCAITSAGALDCWGSDSNGQLGDDVGGNAIPVPVSAP